MKAETLKEYASKHGWELYYSRVLQDWHIRRNKPADSGYTPDYLVDPTFEAVHDVIESIENVLTK